MQAKPTKMRLYFNVEKWKPTKNELLKALSGLDLHEIEKHFKYLYKKHFKLSLLGSLLIRYAACRMLNLKWDEIEIGVALYGKPFIKNKQADKYDFNISHDGNITCLSAVNDNDKKRHVGVDVMMIKDNDSLNKQILPDVLGELEIRQIYQETSSRDQIIAFYRIWCLKECFIKNIGMGLNFDLKNIEFILNSTSSLLTSKCETSQKIELFIDKKKTEQFKFDEQILNNHIITVCESMTATCLDTERYINKENRFREVKINDLLEILVALTFIDETYWHNYEVKPEV